MKKNKRADTIAGIIIAVFILSFAMLGIVSILDYNQDISSNYEKETDLYILKSNSENILKRLNIDHIQQDEKFWIYRNEANQRYEVVTGTGNEHLKYVDKDGKNIDPAGNIGKTFIREFEKKIDILRYDVKPPEINNLVFHFDATNIDGTNNSTITHGQSINRWVNLAGNGAPDFVPKMSVNRTISLNSNPWTRTFAPYASSLPTFNIDGMNLKSMVEFNGTNQMMGMDRHALVNNDGDIYSNRVYMEKSFAIVFKTSDDLINRQVIYEQGGAATGYNFYIENGRVRAGILNYAQQTGYANTGFNNTDNTFYFEWDTGHKQKSVSLSEVLPNTMYFIMIVQDSSNLNRTARPIIEDIKDKRYIDSQNKLKIYLNGILADEIDHVDAMPEHSFAGLGNVFIWSVSPAYTTLTLVDDIGATDTAYFKGGIGELISRNHALTENEIRGVQNYFSQKWLGGKSSIRYDIVETTIKEFKDY